MTTVVISQPMFFPWVGLFEQINRADVYVHYDDVQFSKGGFTNRVQIWNGKQVGWLTVPLRNTRLELEIRSTRIDCKRNWRRKHINLLSQAYARAPYAEEMLEIVNRVYGHATETIAELSIASIEAVCSYFELDTQTRFIRSSDLGIAGSSTQRVLDIVQYCGGTRYVTGHGARHYFDHELLERHGIDVEYMDYRKLPYPQLGEQFTPYISILDLIANRGKAGVKNICSETIHWKQFTA